MANNQNRIISEQHKGKHIPTQNAKRKKTNTHLADQRIIQSLKNSLVTKPFPAEQTKLMKEEITALKQEMEFILGVTKTGLDIIDSQFNIRYIDPEWAKVCGDPTEKKCYEYFMDRSEVCPGCGIPIALKTKRVAVTEETLVKEGNRPIQVTTIPFQDGDGEWLVAEVNVDISERKRTEEALRKAHEELELRVQERTAELARANEAMQAEIIDRKRTEESLRKSEEKYRNILESIQDGYFEVDLAGNFTFLNDVSCQHLGYSRDELIGTNNRQYVDEKMAKELYQLFNRIYRTGKPIKPLEIEYIRKDGTKLIAEISPSLIRDSDGKPIGFRGISRDITERKQAEEEKLSLQEQLRQSQKMEAIGQLAGGVAHDFNNLLTVIKGYSQLSLLDLKENDSLRGNIQEIEKATQRATDLTRQLLAFSRRQILDLKVLDLNVLLKDLEKMLRRIIGEDIQLVTLLSEDLGKVKIDPSQIEQVIFNLAVNARDAMPSGGKLAIETANVELDEEYAHAHVSVAPGRYVRLSVSDTGVGMTQEVKERVFEPFFTTKEKGKGTGLGLSMVYGIVKQSNGNIWLYSEPGRGTTFRIYFPRTDEEADTLHEREETAFFPKGSETILLVEDDELVRDLATRLLEQQGYRVLKATNGQEALLVAKERVGETIHLLLADIVMPQMGGKELADWLKISRPNVKVLYTSGYADNTIVHHGVLDPGTHFLQKPFSLKTLSHKVREVLDG